MQLSQELLHKCVPRASDKKIILYSQAINLTCDRYEINSILRIAAFLAQIAHESANFYYSEEIASGAAYDNRKDLGNTEEVAIKIAQEKNTTPGRLYKGRGLIQLTGFYNYREYSRYKKQDFLENPEQVGLNPMFATDVAGWYWQNHGLNSLADKKLFKTITKRINGGLNGYADRLENYKHILQALQ